MAVEDLSLDRDDVKPNLFKSHKFKAGEVVRAGLVFVDKAKIFKGAQVHYADRYFLCKSTKEQKAICCTASYKGNNTRWRIGSVLVIYEIQKIKGDDGKIKEKLVGYKVVPWVFSEKVYQMIKASDEQFPLEAHDILITCGQNEEFQNITVQACNACYWRSKEELKSKVLDEYDALVEGIAKNLGADFSLEEIREQIGIDTPGSEDAASDVKLDDVLDGI